MKKSAAALLVTLAVLAPAGAALATVEDQSGVLSPDARAHLEQDLGNINGHHFDVLFVDHATGSLDALAKQQFRQHHLGTGDGLIAVAVGDKRVAVHLGDGFRRHGVDSSSIKSHLRSDFFPQAKQGHFDVATENLAKGLLSDAGVSPTYGGSGSHNVAPHHVGFPWGLLIGVAAIGGGIWWFLRKRGANQLLPRIKDLKERHAKIVAQALRLDEVETLGRFREGDVAKEYQKLARRSSELLTESRDFGEKLLEAETLAKKGNRAQAEPLIQQLEGRVTGLGSDVASALTTLDRLEGTTGLKGDESDLPRLVSRLSRRYQELKDGYAELQKRAPSGYNRDATVESRLAESEHLLTTVPVDAKEAERAIMDATDALDAYRRTVEGEADREAVRQGSYGWAESPSYLPYMMLPGGYHRPYFYSTYYEPPVVVYQDTGGWGSDAGGSWGSDAGGSLGGDDRRDSGWFGGGSDAGGSWGGDSGDSGGWGGDSGGGSDFGGGGDW